MRRRQKLTTPERRKRKRLRDRERRQKRKAEKAKATPVPVSGTSSLSAVPTQPALKHRLVRVTASQVPEILSMEGNVVSTVSTTEAEIRTFNRAQNGTGMDVWLEKELLAMMIQKSEDTFNLKLDAKVDQLREDLPRLRRAEENDLLREVPANAKNVCQMGDSCESVRMSNTMGVSPPIRLACVSKNGIDFKQCLMCLRNCCTSQLLRLRMDRCGMVREGCLQSHANFVDTHGEYRKVGA